MASTRSPSWLTYDPVRSSSPPANALEERCSWNYHKTLRPYYVLTSSVHVLIFTLWYLLTNVDINLNDLGKMYCTFPRQVGVLGSLIRLKEVVDCAVEHLPTNLQTVLSCFKVSKLFQTRITKSPTWKRELGGMQFRPASHSKMTPHVQKNCQWIYTKLGTKAEIMTRIMHILLRCHSCESTSGSIWQSKLVRLMETGVKANSTAAELQSRAYSWCSPSQLVELYKHMLHKRKHAGIHRMNLFN